MRTNPRKPKQKTEPNLWFAVIGRISFDDKDSCLIYKTKSPDHAAELFCREMWEIDGFLPEHLAIDGTSQGRTILISYILESKTEIDKEAFRYFVKPLCATSQSKMPNKKQKLSNTDSVAPPNAVPPKPTLPEA